MSTDAESSVRSNLIDVSYAQLHETLGGGLDGTPPRALKEYLLARKDTLSDLKSIFGKPSDASRKKIQNGSLKLADGVTVKIDEPDKEYIFAISDRYHIDEVQAFILFRSFLFNRGLPERVKADAPTAELKEGLLEVIAPYYYSERLFVIKTLGPLLRAYQDTEEPLHDVATEFLPEIAHDPIQFALDLVTEYVAKTREMLPDSLRMAPKSALEWIKQNLKEQLALLEVVFWTMWGYTPCASPVVVQIFKAAYDTTLGTAQANSTLMLDEESQQLLQDSAAYWILITVEALELEHVGHDDVLELSETPTGKILYISSPDTLSQLHDIVNSDTNSQFACTYLAWTYVLSRIVAKAKTLEAVPPAYQNFLNMINPTLTRAYTKDPEPLHVDMAKACIAPEAGLFSLLNNLLTKSPVFVLSAAWKTGSSVTEPNMIAYRSVLKGLVLALVELVHVELIPDFEGLVDVWVALFGRSESHRVAPLCAQFWQEDWMANNARRAIFDVARNRFPVQVRPLVKLLRAMTGSGFLDTDSLSTADHGPEGVALTPERQVGDRFVYYFFKSLPSYTQVIPLSSCTGAHASYERLPERYASGSTAFTYTNLRPVRLPGGSLLPARSLGTVVSADSGDYIIVSWMHQHSGWKVLLEILTDYVNRRHLHYTPGGQYQEVSFGRRGTAQVPLTLEMQDVGMDVSEKNDEAIVTEALDLLRSVIQANPDQAEVLMAELEDGSPVVSHRTSEAQPPDLVQLTTMVLEEALTRSNGRAKAPQRIQLITSAISVLSALLANPTYSNRVWLYIRSTTALFGTDKQPGYASSALSLERATGHYTMTLAILYLVQQLFYDASLSILPDNAKLQQVKEEVLLRAVRFVHTEIWIEHLGWKYAQLGDRFEIGRRISTLYSGILKHSPPSIESRPYALLSQTIGDVLLFKATSSTITPLVSTISSGGHMSRMLRSSRRYADTQRLLLLLGSLLRLSRQILNLKLRSNMATKPSLLEQSLCARVIGNGTSHENIHIKQEPIDVLASYVKDRDIDTHVSLQSIRLLTTLATSMSVINPSPPTIVGHLSDPESIVSAFVSIIQHPFDDPDVRIALWNFISLVVDTEPALGSLFVAGKFRRPTDGDTKVDVKGKGKEPEGTVKGVVLVTKSQSNVLNAAQEFLATWKELWEVNPELLSAILHLLAVVWEHALEHKASIQSLQGDAKFWGIVGAIVQEELGPAPEYDTTEIVSEDKIQHSNNHAAAACHAYRTLAKSYAVQLLSLDIGYHLASGAPSKKPESFLAIEGRFKDEDELSELLSEAAPSPYAPALYDEVTATMKKEFPGLSMVELELQEPQSDRLYGDRFTFSLPLLQDRLQAYRANVEVDAMDDPGELVIRSVMSVNLNLSLSHAQNALAERWEAPAAPGQYRTSGATHTSAPSLSTSPRPSRRLPWFSSKEKPGEMEAFLELVKNIREIILNKAHRLPLLQLIFFCAKEAVLLMNRPKPPNSDQRLTISQAIDAALNLVLEGLGVVFLSAQTRQDVDLDRDMELLVSTSPPPRHTGSQDVKSRTSCGQVSNSLRARTSPGCPTSHSSFQESTLSTRPISSNSTCPSLATPSLQSDWLGKAYSRRTATTASAKRSASARVDIVMPELPGERSPVHVEYCSMLGVVAAVITAVGKHNHYFDAEACGFVQLYGDQISRALSWTVGDSITMPLVEEIEQTVNLFYAIAASVPNAAKLNDAVTKVLRVFTTHSLLLLQQINYAVVHPNHLASLFEPVSPEERTQHERGQGVQDPLKRPLIAHLMHRLFRLSSNIVGTLVCISKADVVLCGSQEDWPVGEALIVPHSKVVLGEPASLGTLLELGNRSLEIMPRLYVRQGLITARRNLESIQLYSVTQLAMWLSKPEFAPGQEETDEAMDVQKPDSGPSGLNVSGSGSGLNFSTLKVDRRVTGSTPRSTSISMAERLRRGMDRGHGE
ncbi:hypothetical protein FA13DRAFT_1773993 [Coprinellus micaceus]|uniref:Nucleoporin NUP188 n=1 Tax=Coprinellus micaceus TaxID=71717 RepID=A0A4Y7TFI7_COPMI|nr:hypothetical protein FA13DRAFT_1773993 [Coprinellus micaceus]